MCFLVVQASDGTVEGMIVALRRRMRSIWQGVQAVEVGKKSRLSRWEKAHSDTHSITEAYFLKAHRFASAASPKICTQTYMGRSFADVDYNAKTLELQHLLPLILPLAPDIGVNAVG